MDVDFMDHAEFFNALFGSDRFEHLVGELMIASAARNGDLNSEQMRRMQVSISSTVNATPLHALTCAICN